MKHTDALIKELAREDFDWEPPELPHWTTKDIEPEWVERARRINFYPKLDADGSFAGEPKPANVSISLSVDQDGRAYWRAGWYQRYAYGRTADEAIDNLTSEWVRCLEADAEAWTRTAQLRREMAIGAAQIVKRRP